MVELRSNFQSNNLRYQRFIVQCRLINLFFLLGLTLNIDLFIIIATGETMLKQRIRSSFKMMLIVGCNYETYLFVSIDSIDLSIT
jgi:hypothetical protein